MYDEIFSEPYDYEELRAISANAIKIIKDENHVYIHGASENSEKLVCPEAAKK